MKMFRKQILLAAAILCAFATSAYVGSSPAARIELPSGTIAPAEAVQKAARFEDVPASEWYSPAVVYCVNSQIMTGVSPTAFAPEEATSRAMLATILYRRAGSPEPLSNNPFADVPANSWYSKAIAWAKDSNIINGSSDGSFLPDNPITREQLATILWRYAGGAEAGDYSQFSDHSEIAQYASDAVYWARTLGIISGKSNNIFDPKGAATRAETASILWRYFESDTIWGGNSEPDTPSEVITVSIEVDGTAFSAKFHDTASAKAIAAQMPFTLDMSDFSSQEKVAALTFDLPAAATQTPPEIHEGEIYLWSGNQLVLFYTTFSNSYSYVPVGSIEDVAGLREALGSASAKITFRAT